MSGFQVLALLLAVSVSLHVGVGTALVLRRCGAGTVKAVLAGGGAMGGVLGLYVAAVAAYR